MTLAGCVTTDHDAEVRLTIDGMPETVRAGEPFTFTMEGQGDASSSHVGAHFWSTPTDDPDADFDQAGGCVHAPGETTFPATVEVTCTLEAGEYQLRGHARTGDADHQHDFWSAPFTVTAVDYNLTSEDTFDTATVDEPAAFTLVIVGEAGATSDHIGAHYFADDVADPTASFDDQAGGCAHQPEPMEVPGTFTVACTFGAAGTYHVFGHLRVADEHDFWADSFEVTVS